MLWRGMAEAPDTAPVRASLALAGTAAAQLAFTPWHGDGEDAAQVPWALVKVDSVPRHAIPLALVRGPRLALHIDAGSRTSSFADAAWTGLWRFEPRPVVQYPSWSDYVLRPATTAAVPSVRRTSSAAVVLARARTHSSHLTPKAASVGTHSSCVGAPRLRSPGSRRCRAGVRLLPARRRRVSRAGARRSQRAGMLPTRAPRRVRAPHPRPHPLSSPKADGALAWCARGASRVPSAPLSLPLAVAARWLASLPIRTAQPVHASSSADPAWLAKLSAWTPETCERVRRRTGVGDGGDGSDVGDRERGKDRYGGVLTFGTPLVHTVAVAAERLDRYAAPWPSDATAATTAPVDVAPRCLFNSDVPTIAHALAAADGARARACPEFHSIPPNAQLGLRGRSHGSTMAEPATARANGRGHPAKGAPPALPRPACRSRRRVRSMRAYTRAHAALVGPASLGGRRRVDRYSAAPSDPWADAQVDSVMDFDGATSLGATWDETHLPPEKPIHLTREMRKLIRQRNKAVRRETHRHRAG